MTTNKCKFHRKKDFIRITIVNTAEGKADVLRCVKCGYTKVVKHRG